MMLTLGPRLLRTNVYPKKAMVKTMAWAKVKASEMSLNKVAEKMAMARPNNTNSKEVHIDFSFLLFAAMAINGAIPQKANSGNEGINHARLNRTVPAPNKANDGMLFFFPIYYDHNFSFHFSETKVLDYLFQWSSDSFLVNLGKLS